MTELERLKKFLNANIVGFPIIIANPKIEYPLQTFMRAIGTLGHLPAAKLIALTFWSDELVFACELHNLSVAHPDPFAYLPRLIS